MQFLEFQNSPCQKTTILQIRLSQEKKKEKTQILPSLSSQELEEQVSKVLDLGFRCKGNIGHE